MPPSAEWVLGYKDTAMRRLMLWGLGLLAIVAVAKVSPDLRRYLRLRRM